MSENKTIIENILRECVKALGAETSIEIIKTLDTNTNTKEEKKKRIPRMTPAISTQLKNEFNTAGKNQEDKEFDKSKKEFIKYVDDMTDDQFSAKSLTDHMKDFVNHDNKPVEKEKPKKTKKAASKKEEKEELQPPTNVATIHDVTHQELQKIKLISTPAGPKNGVYWDGDTGRWVRGPDADENEDLVEMGHKLKTYMVGEKSGRIYEDQDGKDVFQGFVGVGEFKDMKMP